MPIRACHCCGLVQRVPPLRAGEFAVCTRCEVALRTTGAAEWRSLATAALTVVAFVLYWPAILLPIVEVERLGQRHATSILSGTAHLIRDGDWFVGGVVFAFSVVLPLVKICLLLELSLLRFLQGRHRALTYRFMELVGKWSMLDVLLLALLVMLIKMRSLVSFHFGPAIYAFAFCVVLNMLAALLFDPHALWDE